MAGALNFSAFDRAPWIRPDGTLTREAQAAMVELQRRSGGVSGTVHASTISTSPAGGLAGTNVEAQLNELDFEKQAKDATLSAVSGVPTAADKLIYFTGSDLAAACDFTSFARDIVAGLTAAAVRTTLGLSPDGVGYVTGNGGTQTQITSKATGVTLNKLSGDVTLNAAALAANTTVSFTLTNSTIAATDLVLATHNSAGTNGAYGITAQVTAGAALISVRNLTAGSLSEAIVIRFAVFKAATS